MALLLILLFIVVPLAELAVVVAAAESFGLGTTLLALLAFSVAGGWLMKREGTAVWRRANSELHAGRPPARELMDGAMILAGGALLLTPGFLTDLVGLLLLVPPVRALLAPLALRSLAKRASRAVAGATRADASGYARGTRGFRTVIIDTDLFEDSDTPGGPGSRRSTAQPSARVVRVDPDDPGPSTELPPGN